jgi:hypothetical protein
MSGASGAPRGTAVAGINFTGGAHRLYSRGALLGGGAVVIFMGLTSSF